MEVEMKTNLDTDGRQAVDYFIGIEVENTIMKDEMTLFVIGIKDVAEISDLAKSHQINHIYLGTSQCFNPVSDEDWQAWDELISGLLDNGFWVTLDFGVEHAPEVIEYDWNDKKRFVPMISVKIPKIGNFNYFTTVKLDDSTWGDENPGVWCHPLNELMTRATFTSWKDYVGDEQVAPE